MDVKDFEKYLELIELKKEWYSNPRSGDKDKNDKDFEIHMKHIEEFDNLKEKLVKLLFGNQSNVETAIVKLKNTLNNLGVYSYSYSYSDPNKTLNEVKTIREILALLDTYDWKLMYSEYALDSSGTNKQVAVWEQNGDGQIRNHKVWDVAEAIKITSEVTKESGKKIGEALMSIDLDGNMQINGGSIIK